MGNELVLAQIAQFMKRKQLLEQLHSQYRPMWEEDQARGLRPGFQDGYDYWNALKYGIQRDPINRHMGSRAPQTGLLLKSQNHPTFGLTLKGEEEAGYEVYKGKDGRMYSRPKVGK